MPDPAADQLKVEVKSFWNRQACDTWNATSQKFSREYFEEIERCRYLSQPFIHSFAQFTRYHGKRVLEVGFGAGTDFIQWLRAGASATGIDLTEEALEHLTHRIRVYNLPQPERLLVADAENLPFESNSFDLGYSWGVLHHTPDTERAIGELVRVVRPGGEIKIMLYNRHSQLVWELWARRALFKGRPWIRPSQVLWHHMESLGTKSFTKKEVQRMLQPLGLTDIRMETFVDRGVPGVPQKKKIFPFRILKLPLIFAFKLAVDLAGDRIGFYRGITARKL